VEVKDPSFGAAPNAFFAALAKAAPRGHYPRGFSGEQAYWTVVGIDGGLVQGLLSEDGAIEVSPSTPAIEPMLLIGVGPGDMGRRRDRAHAPRGRAADAERPLAREGLVAPHRRVRNRDTAALAARRTLHARKPFGISAHRDAGARVCARFQVNPPTQFLNAPGGVATLHRVEWDGQALSLDGDRRLHPLTSPSEVILAPFDSGNLPRFLPGVRGRRRVRSTTPADSRRPRCSFA
jgi:hypothetical protein